MLRLLPLAQQQRLQRGAPDGAPPAAPRRRLWPQPLLPLRALQAAQQEAQRGTLQRRTAAAAGRLRFGLLPAGQLPGRMHSRAKRRRTGRLCRRPAAAAAAALPRQHSTEERKVIAAAGVCHCRQLPESCHPAVGAAAVQQQRCQAGRHAALHHLLCRRCHPVCHRSKQALPCRDHSRRAVGAELVAQGEEVPAVQQRRRRRAGRRRMLQQAQRQVQQRGLLLLLPLPLAVLAGAAAAAGRRENVVAADPDA